MAKPVIGAHASRLARDLTLASTPAPTAIPKLLYGTAWKKERTQELVYAALKNGFRGIDTAAQPKHYHEAGVGDGVQRAIDEGVVKREDLFFQSKFTPPSGQGDIMPYRLDMPLRDQVRMSVGASISRVKAEGLDDYLDSLVLHSPLPNLRDTLEVWKTFEEYHPNKVRNLGISNTDLSTLKYLYENAQVKPTIVQNRFHERTGYEVELREYCESHNIIFQSFWTLSANPGLARSQPVIQVSEGAGVPAVAAFYSLVLGLGNITILDGTTQEVHMKEDLEGIEKVGSWAEGDGSSLWESALATFKKLIGEH